MTTKTALPSVGANDAANLSQSADSVGAHTPYLDNLILSLPNGIAANAALDLKLLKDSHAALVARLQQVLPYLQKMDADGAETAKPVATMIRQVEATLAEATQ